MIALPGKGQFVGFHRRIEIIAFQQVPKERSERNSEDQQSDEKRERNHLTTVESLPAEYCKDSVDGTSVHKSDAMGKKLSIQTQVESKDTAPTVGEDPFSDLEQFHERHEDQAFGDDMAPFTHTGIVLRRSLLSSRERRVPQQLSFMP